MTVVALLGITSSAFADHAAYPELNEHATRLLRRSARMTEIVSQDFRTALLYRQMIDRSIELEQRTAKLKDLSVYGGSYGNIMAELARIQGDVAVLDAWVRDSVFRAEHRIDPPLPACSIRASKTIAVMKDTIDCARNSAKVALNPPVIVVPQYQVQRVPVATTQVVIQKNYGRPSCSGGSGYGFNYNHQHGHQGPSVAGFGLNLNFSR